MSVPTRTEVQESLYRLVRAVDSAVAQAQAAVQKSSTCTSLFFSDENSCQAMKKNVRKLEDMSIELWERIADLDGHDITQQDVEFIQKRGQLIIDSAKSQGDVDTVGLTDVFNATLKDLGAFVGTAVKEVALTGGGAVASFVSGLGVVGVLFVAGLVFVAVKARS